MKPNFQPQYDSPRYTDSTFVLCFPDPTGSICSVTFENVPSDLTAKVARTLNKYRKR